MVRVQLIFIRKGAPDGIAAVLYAQGAKRGAANLLLCLIPHIRETD